MTPGISIDDEEKLRRLDEFVEEEVSKMSSDELRVLVSDEEAAAARASALAAMNRAGKERLSRAKAEFADYKQAAGNVRSLDQARSAKLQKYPRWADQPTTLAARGGAADHEADAPGIQEDLDELANWKSTDDKD